MRSHKKDGSVKHGQSSSPPSPEISIDLTEVEKILSLGGLPPMERRYRVEHFSPRDLDLGSDFWLRVFDGTTPKFMSAPPTTPDMVVGASAAQFVLCLRRGLTSAEQTLLLRHAAAHLALGHVRLGDAYLHADQLEKTRVVAKRRWDVQVEEFLVHVEAQEPRDFSVQGLSEAFQRLVLGELDQAIMSAVQLLQTYVDELVDIPQGLNDRAQLFPHQTRGIAELAARLRRFNVAVLADSVGLGKTRLACALVKALNDTGQATRAAIVTPRKLERNWVKEFAVVGLKEGENVALVNKDMLKRWTSQESASALRGCNLIIVEEAHQDLRNPGNRFHRNIRDSVGVAPGLLVTATPWNNRRGDIFSILLPFVRPAPGTASGMFDCFKKGVRTGRREFEESDEIFHRVYGLTVLQRTRRQLRELGDQGVYYAPRSPSLDVVPYRKKDQEAFRKLLGVVEALRLPYFNPVRFLTSEHDSEWRLSGTHRFFLLKRAESSIAAFRVTLHGMRERARQLQEQLKQVADDENAIGRWLAGTYRISEDIAESVLDTSLEGGLLEERVTRPRQRRVLRLIREAIAASRLKRLRKRLLADCKADIQLLDQVELDFASLFKNDPKIELILKLVKEKVKNGQKVLLTSQFADTAFEVYHSLLADAAIRPSGVGLIMSTAKGGEPPVQFNGREATRDEVLWRFAPVAWQQNASEMRQARATGMPAPVEQVAVLVGTDTISVGQNLQDARTIFHVDLTWNPMVLEQRIGRLDRPRHEGDSAPIEIRYFLNLDLIEAELELKKRIDARLEATYRDTAFDDEILPGYFELIERMRKLRSERAQTADISRELDSLLEELAAARPINSEVNGVDSRRIALERLREACAHVSVPDPTPPLIVTLGHSNDGMVECAAQIEFQAQDNNERPISSPERRLVLFRREVGTPSIRLDELQTCVEAVLRGDGLRAVSEAEVYETLRLLEVAILNLCAAIKDERNRLREKRRQVRERSCPPWLGPLVRNVRAFLERLSEKQYAEFLNRWNLSDDSLGHWFDVLAAGIDLDDPDLVEKLRHLESEPSAILDTFGVVKDAVPLDNEAGAPAQLDIELEPVVQRVEARVTNLRVNLPAEHDAMNASGKSALNE